MSSGYINERHNLFLADNDSENHLSGSLDELVEKTAADQGAPFASDVLAQLAELKKKDRQTFETVRAQLKKAGCRVAVLDGAIAEANGDVGGRSPTQADILIELAQSVELFHASDGTAFADLEVSGHRETWPVRAKGFKRWLARRFYEATESAFRCAGTKNPRPCG